MIKIATLAQFDEGMNDLPSLPPNAAYLKRGQHDFMPPKVDKITFLDLNVVAATVEKGATVYYKQIFYMYISIVRVQIFTCCHPQVQWNNPRHNKTWNIPHNS
jgi:hypothetical protein